MGTVLERSDDRTRAFIEAQPVFFVASAPSGDQGRVNLSPKGVGGTFCQVDDHTVAYLDLTASGAETIAHLRQNGRITLMFCAFAGPPNVVRLHGTGRVGSIYDDEFADWLPRFREHRGARAVIVVDVSRISTSCGYGVPSWSTPASVICCRRTWTARASTGGSSTDVPRTASASTAFPPSPTTNYRSWLRRRTTRSHDETRTGLA
ncbi:MAG: pyridoxamine 5'-phosphate oxidase family protein [Nocardioidaceae bacterium]